MDGLLINVLEHTQSSQETIRKSAELQLLHLYKDPAFPLTLASISGYQPVPASIRQSALLALKAFVLAAWSTQSDEFKGQVLISEENKSLIRSSLLDLATSDTAERKVQNAAAHVVSKIASADFPDQWPTLLPTLLQLASHANHGRLHGALKVLAELVEDGLSEEQFFRVAKDLVNVLYCVVLDDGNTPVLRALAMSVFRGCFDTLDVVLEDHKSAVKMFMDEVLATWKPLFLSMLKLKLPAPPVQDVDHQEDIPGGIYRGLVALKLQSVKVLMRIRTMFPTLLSPHSLELFSAVWEELTILQPNYQANFVDDAQEGRLEDADSLPYTLDFLVLEDLDFMQACLRAPPVKKELEQQLKAQTDVTKDISSNWMANIVRLAVSYAQITSEEESLWSFDVNVFLSEETNITANYTARTACGDLAIKLGEWLPEATMQAIRTCVESLYSSNSSWRAKEAILYVLGQVLSDWQDVDRQADSSITNDLINLVRSTMQQQEEFLRARGHLAAAILVKSSGEALHPIALSLMEATIRGIIEDKSEIVQVSCIRALQLHLQCLPPSLTLPLQAAIVTALTQWSSSKDLSDMADGGDLMITLVETLRDTLMLDPHTSILGEGLILLFNVASHNALNFQLCMVVSETFEAICSRTAKLDSAAYFRLCEQVIPSLISAFDMGNITEENALINLAAQLLSDLTKHASMPLPQGFVATILPRVNRLVLTSEDDELLRCCTSTLQHILQHDPVQVFSFRDHESGKSGLEVILITVSHLLGPAVEDNAAAEVGGLAAELVETAGSERLGPYLTQLLHAVAVRLTIAKQAQLIQSLILVFARLATRSPQEVLDFLAQVQIEGQDTGLQSIMSIWLENSASFAGYDAIKQNVIALTKLYQLHDPRLTEVLVKGDLVMPQSDRIVTRSKAKHTPDQHTVVSVQVKMLKVLVEELSTASSVNEKAATLGLAHAATDGLDEDDDEDDDDGDWEDEASASDLGLGIAKQDIMALANDDPGSPRRPDDETHAYLVDFFHVVGRESSFHQLFNALNPQEQDQLRALI